jgi:AcrR family transcriptional regulator
MPRRTGADNRRNVLEVATRLFYGQGIRAVGMDAVVKACGVGNATVYRQFPSKDALAAAYVRDRADAWFLRMRQAADNKADPRDKLVAVFEVLAADTAAPGYRGCPMLNTSTEFPERNHPAHLESVSHEEQVCAWFRTLSAAAGAGDPDRLAEELIVILNGAYATADVLGGSTYGTRALGMARRLIDEECRTPIAH